MQRPLGLEPVERLARLGVDPGVVRIHVRRQIDVRAADVQEAVRVSLRQGRRLAPVHDVVRHRRDPLGELGGGADGTEGVETHGRLGVGG